MKLIRLLLFLFASSRAANFFKFIKNDNLVNGDLIEAVNRIIQEIFVPRYPTVNLIYAVEDDCRHYSRSIVTELVIRNGGNAAFSLKDYQKIGRNETAAIQASIVLLDSIGSFRKFNEKVESKVFMFGGHFLFLLVNGKKFEHDEVYSALWEKHIYNVDSIYDNGKVETFLPFGKNSTCGDTKPVHVNHFKNGKFENGLESVFPEKLLNLQNCSIRFVTFADTFSVKKINSSDGSLKLSGYDVEMMTALASSLNFHVQLTFLESVPVPWGNFVCGGVFLVNKFVNKLFLQGIVYPNGTVSNALGEIYHQRADVVIGNFYLEKNRLKCFDSSITYHSFPLVFVIPPGKLEKCYFLAN